MIQMLGLEELLRILRLVYRPCGRAPRSRFSDLRRARRRAGHSRRGVNRISCGRLTRHVASGDTFFRAGWCLRCRPLGCVRSGGGRLRRSAAAELAGAVGLGRVEVGTEGRLSRTRVRCLQD